MVKDKGMNSLYNKLANNELPFTGYISSSNGQPASMKVSQASIVRDGVETVLFQDEITLSVNSISGDNTQETTAVFSVPTNPLQKPELRTTGNATITNQSERYAVNLLGGKKEIKVKSPKGLFAIIRIKHQGDADFDFFDILFGVQKQDESKDQDGRKDRAHLSIYPDGNGKFIRLSSHQCELESELGYDAVQKNIFPSKLTIHSTEFSEKLIVLFEFNLKEKKAVLTEATFQ